METIVCWCYQDFFKVLPITYRDPMGINVYLIGGKSLTRRTDDPGWRFSLTSSLRPDQNLARGAKCPSPPIFIPQAPYAWVATPKRACSVTQVHRCPYIGGKGYVKGRRNTAQNNFSLSFWDVVSCNQCWLWIHSMAKSGVGTWSPGSPPQMLMSQVCSPFLFVLSLNNRVLSLHHNKVLKSQPSADTQHGSCCHGNFRSGCVENPLTMSKLRSVVCGSFYQISLQ